LIIDLIRGFEEPWGRATLIVVYVDGLAMPRNPGTGTYGFIVYKDGKKFDEGYGLVGENVTNNYAEYVALIRALSSLLSHSDEEVTVRSDSRLLVNQMKGEWKRKKGAYLVKYKEANELAKMFRSLKFVWIPREANTEADELSRVAYSEFTRKKK
jgi:ribonuclease HI